MIDYGSAFTSPFTKEGFPDQLFEGRQSWHDNFDIAEVLCLTSGELSCIKGDGLQFPLDQSGKLRFVSGLLKSIEQRGLLVTGDRSDQRYREVFAEAFERGAYYPPENTYHCLPLAMVSFETLGEPHKVFLGPLLRHTSTENQLCVLLEENMHLVQRGPIGQEYPAATGLLWELEAQERIYRASDQLGLSEEAVSCIIRNHRSFSAQLEHQMASGRLIA